MTTVVERLRTLAAALPSDASSVTFTRSDLLTLVEGSDVAPSRPRDLTVDEVAERMGRAPSTVRSWLGAGQLRGYKLNKRDWRVPADALRAYAEGPVAACPTPEAPHSPEVDIAAWRQIG